MSQSTLVEMHAIENEAREIYESYQQKIVESKEQIDVRLKSFVETYDKETQEQVESLRENIFQREQSAKATLAENVLKNEQQLSSALNDKKDLLIQQIVEKVVKYYGD